MADPSSKPALYPGAPDPPGGSPVVDWIRGATRPGHTITAAIPPIFERYATVLIPEEFGAKTRADAALVEVLHLHTPQQPWWFGYLDTGVADVVDSEAPRVSLYVGWPYVSRQGGPQQALTARSTSNSTPWHSALPELVFPADRSWLVSTMWDDHWRCVGGPAVLIDDLLARPELEARSVLPEEDATPPGHQHG